MTPEIISDEVALAYWAKEGEQTFEAIVNRVASFLFPEGELTPMGTSPEDFRQLLLTRKFSPNSPCWMNAGTELKSLAACFVLPLDDSMESIFDTAKSMALIMKEGGGVGIGLSSLRPANSKVRKTKGVSSGPISFLKVFNSTVETVKQGGTR